MIIVLNLKDAIQSKTNYHMLWHIVKLVNEGFFYNGSHIRGVPITTVGSNYVPPIPIEGVFLYQEVNQIDNIHQSLKKK